MSNALHTYRNMTPSKSRKKRRNTPTVDFKITPFSRPAAHRVVVGHPLHRLRSARAGQVVGQGSQDRRDAGEAYDPRN